MAFDIASEGPRRDRVFVDPAGRLTDYGYSLFDRLLKRTGGMMGMDIEEVQDLAEAALFSPFQATEAPEVFPESSQTIAAAEQFADIVQPGCGGQLSEVVWQT